MDRIREQMSRPMIIATTAGIVIGLVIGLIIAWGIWPVQWTDAAASDLRPDLQRDWLRMTIESYTRNRNPQLALQRWQELGDKAPEIFAEVIADPSVDPEAAAVFGNLVNAQASAQQPPAAEGEQQTAQPTAPAEAETTGGPNLTTWLVVLCVLLLVVGGAAFWLLVLRKRPGGTIFPSPRQPIEAGYPPAEHIDFTAEGQEPPIAQFMTTYVLGEDAYDDSFSIDSPTGEFLGECGVGISDTIGVGDPKKVTAFEVWLFDKNDIQTVTKVLMSEHAYDDPNIRQRLESKGEPVVVEPGQHILLDTATLRLEARVVDMNYGQGALPPSSYFDRMTLELAIWQKMP